MEAARQHAQEVREELRRTRVVEMERTKPTMPQATVPERINNVTTTEQMCQMRLDQKGTRIRATMLSQGGRNVLRAV